MDGASVLYLDSNTSCLEIEIMYYRLLLRIIKDMEARKACQEERQALDAVHT